MKVAINVDYGGFGISPEALYELVKMKSNVVEVCSAKEYKHTRWEPWKHGYKLANNYTVLYKKGKAYSLKYNADRSNLDLIKVIKKLRKKANDTYAKIKIVTIPDGVKWKIEEYDGVEWISELHRTWR